MAVLTGIQAPHALLDGGLAGRKLQVVVIFTTGPAAVIALRTAARLAEGLQASIRLLVPQVVPYPAAPAQSHPSQQIAYAAGGSDHA